MHKNNHKSKSLYKRLRNRILQLSLIGVCIASLSIILVVSYLFFLDQKYVGKVYPRVYIGNLLATGKTPQEISLAWEQKNLPFQEFSLELNLESTVATISGLDLHLGYNAPLIARHAFQVGRSGSFLSDVYTKLFKRSSVIEPYFEWNQDALDEVLNNISASVDIKPQDSLFEFANGKVTTFKPAKNGKRLNRELVIAQIENSISQIKTGSHKIIKIPLIVDVVEPDIATSAVNNYGIKEKLGTGHSIYPGSISGRIHNVALAASKFHGVLIAPGEIISYNKIVGDISQATGYQPAYIIKDGRTVLGDGGGVCQVSTTLFRAALAAGLPIIERQAHAYRVHYYEDGGYKPGLDATVFAPSVDLKIKNDTPAYLLIQSRNDPKTLTLEIDIYGTNDGRVSQITNHKIFGESPPPPPLYQDDPTLPNGVVKQVDWAAWGAKTTFTYKVVRNGETLIDQEFISNYRPWQAVYLRGIM